MENSTVQKVVTVTVGVVATLFLLLFFSFLLQRMPLPDTAALGDAYWQSLPQQGAGLGTLLAQQAGLVARMLMNVWLLWLVPLCGALVTALLVNRDSDSGEMAVYLERIHLLEHALGEARNAAELYGGRWEGLNSKFDQLFEHSAEIWLVVDKSGGIRRWNKAALDLARRFHPGMGDVLEGKPLSDVVGAQDLPALLGPVRSAFAEGGVANGEVYLPTVGQHFLAWIFPLGDEVAMVLRDISHRYKDNAFLQSSERLARQLVEDSVRPVAVLDPDWRYMYVSRKWAEVLGLDSREALVGLDHRVKVPDFPRDRRVYEQQLAEGRAVARDDERRQLGEREMLLSWAIRPWMDAFGRLGGYIFTVLDTTEQTRLRQQVEQAEERENALAYSDALTGLPNRQLFNDRLNMSLAQAYRQLGKVALFFLDLDGFKAVNDTLGHDYGDLLLKQVAGRLKECVRTTDTVARLGGDEFTIILAIRDKVDAEQVAEKVLKRIREPYELNGKVADKVGTSIGIALYPQDGTQAADLIRKADAAMYAAKQGGKNAWRFSTVEVRVVG